MGGGTTTATATFLFVDLVGSTELLHRLGDDANDRLTHRYQRLMREVVDRHGGDVLRTAGDGLTVVFERSVAAAVASAVDMQRAIDRMGRADPLLRLQIRVGLSVGEASPMDGDWSGTPLFEAARLESKARPGTILVNDVIRALLGNRGGFEFIPVGALELKGFPEPLAAAEVAWEPDPGRAEVPLASALEVGLDWPLVGREQELRQLTDAWRAAAEGRPRLIVITGDGGIGKTRMAAELAAAVQRGTGGLAAGTVLYGRGGDDPGPPLGPFAEALRWWAASVTPEVLRATLETDAALLAGIVPSLAARLPELLGGAVASDADRLADAVVRVVGRATQVAGPWLLVVDNAQAADEATAALARRLTESDLRVLVVVLGRGPGSFPMHDAIELGGLASDGTAALVDNVTGRAGVDEVPAEVVARTHTETQGNPRLIIEAGGRLVASGALGLAPGTGRDEVLRRAITGASPYKGLLAYQSDDADDFFGRDTDVAALLARVAATRLLAVVGASGSGKSSLVRAGLLPTLRRGALAGSAEWPQVLFNAGPRPLLELAAGLAGAVGQPAGAVMSALESGPSGLDAVLRDAPSSPVRVVIVVDQFEEIFTACHDVAERERFVETLLHAATVPGGRALVVVVLRSDFFGHCADLPGLAAALESTTVLVGPMEESALRAVIEGPARRADLSLEAGLADSMIHDVAGEPGALPLLSHALVETWERRENRSLTLAGYRDAGGARGAIARTAETVYESRLDPDQQRIARSLFLDLTELGEGTEDTRRRARRSGLAERAGGADRLDPVLDRLVAARLVTVDDDTVEVAHEALIREWPRLRDWLDEDRETLRALRHLSLAADEWDHGGRDPADLYRGPRLAAGLDASRASTLPDRDQRFLDASRELEEADSRRQRAQNRRLRRLLAGVGLMLVLSLVAGLVAYQQRATARERTADADFVRLTSQSLNVLDSNRSLGLLLALEANDARDNVDSRSALFSSLQREQDFLGYTPTEGIPTGSTLADADTLAYATRDATFGFVDLAAGAAVDDPVPLGDRPDALVQVFVAADESRQPGDPIVAGRADTGQVFRIDPRSHLVVGDPIESHQAVFALAASTRLGLVAVGLEDGTVALHDLADGRRVATLPAQDDPTDLGFQAGASQHGRRYGAGGAVPGAGDVTALAFSPTRAVLAVQRPDAAVEFWSTEDVRRVGASAPGDPVDRPFYGDLSFRPDGSQVVEFATTVDGQVRAIDVRSASVDWTHATVPGSGALAYSADGERLYVADGAGDLLTLSPVDGSDVVAGGVSQIGPPAGLAVGGAGPDERLVVASGASPVAAGFRLSGDGAVVHRFGHPGMVVISESPDGTNALFQDLSRDNEISLWDPGHGEVLIRHLPMVVGGHTGDTTLFIVTGEGSAGQYDLERQRRVPPEYDISFEGVTGGDSNAATQLVVLGHLDGTVDFFDPSGPLPDKQITVPDGAQIERFSEDGSRLAVVNGNEELWVYDVASGEAVAGPIAEVSFARIAGDPDRAFVARPDGRVEEIDLVSGDTVGDPFPTLRSPGQEIDLTDDGATLEVADAGSAVRVFDIASRTQIGDDIVAGTVAQGGTNASLSLDGSHLLTGDPEGVAVWDLVPDHWRDIACRLAGRNLTQKEWDTYLPNAGGYRTTCPQWPAGG